MSRSRVMSFMSQFGGPPRSPTSSSSPVPPPNMPGSSHNLSSPPSSDAPHVSKTRVDRPPSRPTSMLQTYHPPLMEVAQDTLPELQPIFTFLNSHSNKLYQEGYFLKLNDLDANGRPNPDRTWTECFAQLVGTVLSLWDAAALDAAGQDGEVVPTFINLTDASVKMIETLPTRAQDLDPLQNVLSISTAGKNRYLLHFNSLHSLTQWTAGIRLAMFEHASLQELYTGSLIAGKGKMLNNIRYIMERSRLKTEDWVRVRFGAGTPWRRCWCVINPPDEKAYQRQQKAIKKKSAYERSAPALKGNIQFYDTKRTKKILPIATIDDAYSAYAIYPQSKPLIDQSTLVKVEGTITIHSAPPTTTEGFVFVMPEVHPAVSGFEMMLRWLFPVFDTFALYGRPAKLIADTLDARGLMFAMPKERRYGYLEILDVAGLIHTDGSQRWCEADWRKKMKDITAKRITTINSNGGRRSRANSRAPARNSLNLPSRPGAIHFEADASSRSSPARNDGEPSAFKPPAATNSAAPDGSRLANVHQRSVSEAQGMDRYPDSVQPSPELAPQPPPHAVPPLAVHEAPGDELPSPPPPDYTPERSSSDSERVTRPRDPMMASSHSLGLPEPVATPTTLARRLSAAALPKPYQSPEMRRANNRMSTDTLSQLAGATGAGNNALAIAGAAAAWKASPDGSRAASRQGVYPSPDVASAGSGPDSSPRWTAMSPAAESVPVGRPLPAAPAAPYAAYRPAEPGPPVPAHQTAAAVAQYGPASQAPTSSHGSHPDGYAAAPAELDSRMDSPEPNATPPPTLQTDLQPTAGDTFEYRGRTISGSLRSTHPPRLRTSASITRKPLPDRSPSSRSAQAQTPQTASSYGSLRNHTVDERALDQVTAQSSGGASEHGDRSLHRQSSHNSSNYDRDSDSTPDYASTRRSTDTKRSAASVERPRAGVMRTVGEVEPAQRDVVVGDVRYQADTGPAAVSSDIPAIDFGPTVDLTADPARRPATSAGRLYGPERSRSSELIGRPARSSPSPIEGPGTSSGQIGPGSTYDLRTRARPPSQVYGDRGRMVSAGSDPDVRRSMVWQPAMATNVGAGPGSNRRSITPEQFVQQRAQQALARPTYSHQRNPSSSTLRSNTPPAGRHGSGESWGSQGRVGSGEYGARPPSRGGSTMFSPTGTVPSADYTAHLSAREQEHVARMTGSPLVQVGGSGARQGAGLVGAIEAREREKREIREGLSGQMVQQAIWQRRQQEAQAHQASQAYYANPNSAPVPHAQPWSPAAQPMGQGSHAQPWSPAAQPMGPGSYAPQPPAHGPL